MINRSIKNILKAGGITKTPKVKIGKPKIAVKDFRFQVPGDLMIRTRGQFGRHRFTYELLATGSAGWVGGKLTQKKRGKNEKL